MFFSDFEEDEKKLGNRPGNRMANNDVFASDVIISHLIAPQTKGKKGGAFGREGVPFSF